MSQIKVGDVVRLKSGGITMSVETMNENGYAKCTWSTGGDIKSVVIQRSALEVVQPPERPNFGGLGGSLA